MEYRSAFHLLSEIIKRERISCVLIGGFAVNYYGFSRQTADVDFLIAEEDFKKISSALEEGGYKEDFRQNVFVRLKSNARYLLDIDFMFVDKEIIGKIIKDGKEIDIARHKFIIPSLDNLLALKLHSLKYNFNIRQSRDLPDIVSLIRINKLDARSGKFHQLCLKYASEDIYRKILEYLR